MEKTFIHGFYVNYDQKDYDGITFLRDNLQYSEAKTIFDAARYNGSANFEDHTGGYGNNWTLTYNSDGTYTLSRRFSED